MTAEPEAVARCTEDRLEGAAPGHRETSVEVADFCSLLSVASRVVITSFGCSTAPAATLSSTLADLPWETELISPPHAFTLDRSDTAIVVAGPELDAHGVRFVEAVIASGAVLLAITTPAPPSPLDRADASIRIPTTSGRISLAAGPWSASRSFEQAALAVVDQAHIRLTELLRRRGGRHRAR
jgi:DNA-binding MurR/RpiR family transcriptional regulator